MFHVETDAIFISATLNCLGALLRNRPTTYNRIISAILNFNPFKLASRSKDSKARLQVKSLEKTTRILLLSMIKKCVQKDTASRVLEFNTDKTVEMMRALW